MNMSDVDDRTKRELNREYWERFFEGGGYEKSDPDKWARIREWFLGAVRDTRTTRQPLRILDVGCGSGEDLAEFSRLGCVAVGIDASPTAVREATKNSGCDVQQGDLVDVEFGTDRFDGVFAKAVLHTIPRAEIPIVIEKIYAALLRDGVLFAAVFLGSEGEKLTKDQQVLVLMSEGDWRTSFEEAGFSAIDAEVKSGWMRSLWRR